MNEQQQRHVATDSPLDIAKAVLPSFDLAGGTLVPLQNLVNASFRVRNRQVDWYLRVYNHQRRSSAEVEAELSWLSALAQAGIAVPKPKRTVAGALYIQWPNRGEEAQSYLACVTSWVAGQIIPGDERCESHYASLGRLLGQIHQHGHQWASPADFQRPHFHATTLQRQMATLRRMQPSAGALLHPIQWHTLEQTLNALLQAEQRIQRTVAQYGLTHGDPSFGNVLYHEAKPTIIDFDDCSYGYLVYDLAVVLAGAWGKANYAANRTALLAGYEAVRTLSTTEVGALPLMMAARSMSLIFWAAATSRGAWIEGQWQRLLAYLAQD